MLLLHQHFIKTAKKCGSKLAFVDRTTGRNVTYSKALIASLILTEKFKKHDEGFFGIMLPTSAGCALSIIAVLMSGRTPVMINYSTGAEGNAKYAQEKCGFRTIITSRALLEKIKCPYIDGMIFIEDIMEKISVLEKLKAAFIAKLPLRMIIKMVYQGDENDDAVILFTSGSEKDPKAVELTHRNIISNIEGIRKILFLSSEDRMFANLPYFHVFGFTVNMWVPLYLGMTVISYANPLDYKMVCSIIKEEKPTVMAGTPSFLRGYLRKSEPGDFSSLRLVVSGADKCPVALIEEFHDKHGIKLLEGYGTTETSPVISANTFDHYRPGSIGMGLPDVQIRIESYETGEECGTGETGRIMVKGDIVMKGYLGDLEETSMRIRHGWYDTGDMGFIDKDGYLWHAGRLKRFVKVGGEMVSLPKTEDVLGSLLPKDVSCCVVETPDALKGSRIIAVVSQDVDKENILKQMSESLPNIAIPKQFVVIEELPKMGSGKIDFRGVTDMVKKILNSSD